MRSYLVSGLAKTYPDLACPRVVESRIGSGRPELEDGIFPTWASSSLYLCTSRFESVRTQRVYRLLMRDEDCRPFPGLTAFNGYPTRHPGYIMDMSRRAQKPETYLQIEVCNLARYLQPHQNRARAI